jgi:hypothetical protein
MLCRNFNVYKSETEDLKKALRLKEDKVRLTTAEPHARQARNDSADSGIRHNPLCLLPPARPPAVLESRTPAVGPAALAPAEPSATVRATVSRR